jgi:membrane protein implicated in regulation of membrane protease activity
MKFLIVKHLLKNLLIIISTIATLLLSMYLSKLYLGDEGYALMVLAVGVLLTVIVRISVDQAKQEQEEQERIERIVIERLRSFGQ